MPEEEAREVLDFAEFLQVKRHRENEEELAEAKDVLRRIEQGEEETVPWEEVKAEYGL